MPDCKLVFISNRRFEDYPPWLRRPGIIDSYPADYEILLHREATALEAELFLLELGFDSFTEDFHGDVARLLEESEPGGLIVPGGVRFWDGQRVIGPGCCCGVEDWKEIHEAVLQGESPWMGHDPWPLMTYDGDSVTVWSDSDMKSPLEQAISIRFDRAELSEKLRAAGERDLRDFLEIPFRRFLDSLECRQTEELLAALAVSLYPD